jgi:hypothetical protein
MKKYFIGKCIAIVFFVALAIIAFGFIVMGLWNWLVPHLFNGPVITFGEALGILVLSKILFGGFHGKKGGGWKHRHCSHCGDHYGSNHWKDKWKEKMKERMSGMTAEEREKFKQKMYKCGWNVDDENNAPTVKE